MSICNVRKINTGQTCVRIYEKVIYCRLYIININTNNVFEISSAEINYCIVIYIYIPLSMTAAAAFKS